MADMAKKMIIKPSSPTSSHLRKVQLSLLDQLAPPVYIHIILYFERCQDLQDFNETSRKLKQSLSDALTVYYPLAGGIREHAWIDCNDAGAEYVEAHFTDTRILDIIERPTTAELGQYVPACGSAGDVPLAVQANFFGCGGIAIGICVSHVVADAMSMTIFINAWANACRDYYQILGYGGKDLPPVDRRSIHHADQLAPCFNLASRFPPQDFSRFFPQTEGRAPGKPEKIVTRRFVFEGKKLEAIKEAASGPLAVKPTKVEAVSAFIWRHFIEARMRTDHTKRETRVFGASHAVDIRHRAKPPLPYPFFGNALGRAMAMTTTKGFPEEPDYYDLVIILRDAITKADGDYVAKLENGEMFLKYLSTNEENDPCFKDGSQILDVCSFTSWSRLPAYEVDYGWGNPAWVSVIDVPQKNLILLLGTKSGDGIEAWVNMAEEDISMIENNYHLYPK